MSLEFLLRNFQLTLQYVQSSNSMRKIFVVKRVRLEPGTLLIGISDPSNIKFFLKTIFRILRNKASHSYGIYVNNLIYHFDML